ncbi:MAG: Outer membrane lipoprotein Blc [uncultured Campylobacterales bacterium]|uniref:Outer membrane lipoprotein Blc n=1 Tax=uncultured Campylobacterales bacterium TaxID=352960 RepID=A0A6S6T6T1_9BACT|nr:MAG: Outer membrane lipoprotein Blc [uncultured Campylobacterales bacterium]
MKKYLMMIIGFIFVGCVKLPEGVEPVKNFEIDRYLGTWYEVARLDHIFEKGMSNVSAEYIKEGDKIKVINRGYFERKKEWREAIGKAYFVDKSDVGFLKVSFFGPFYGSYIINELDEDYQYALISGPNKGYLWILSRSKSLPKDIMDKLVGKASKLGFDTETLIYVEQDK